MRIAYLCTDPGVPIFGTKGASVHVQEIVRAFRAAGDDVTIYTARRGDRVPDDLRDVRVVERRVSAPDTAARERAIERAAAELAQQAIDDGCDLVYERFALFGTAGVTVAEALGVPAIVEVNAPLLEEQRTHRELIDDAGAVRAAHRTLSGAALVACVSEPVAEWARTHGATHTRVTPNGVNTTRIRPATRRRHDGRFVVGFVGTLRPWHGAETLVEAVGQMSPGATLRIVGDGPAAPELRQRAAELGVDLEITGALAPADIAHELTLLDVGVAPYPAGDHYFSPLKVYEYLAAGLPVVASRVGQIVDVIDHGTTGLLTEPGDAASIAEALEQLRVDAAGRDRMGLQARAVAVARHDWRHVLQGVREDLDRAVLA